MAQRKLTQQELAEIDAAGYDVTPIIDQVVEVPDEQFTAGQAYGRNLATSALPSVGAGLGAAGGMKLGALAGGSIGSVVPVVGTAAGAGIGAVVGGLAGGLAGGKATAVVQEEFIPEETKQRTALASQQHPTAAMLGGLSAMPLGGMMPTPSGVANALGGAGKLAAYGANRMTRPVAAGAATGQTILTAAEKQAVINSAVGAGLGPINEVVTAGMEGRDITAKDLALAAGIGATFNSPTPVIGRAMGFHMPPAPQLATEAGFRRAFAAPAAEEVANSYQPQGPKPRFTVADQIALATGIGKDKEVDIPLLDANGNPKIYVGKEKVKETNILGDEKEVEKTQKIPLTVKGMEYTPEKSAAESANALAQAEGRPIIGRLDEEVMKLATEAKAKKDAELAKKAIPVPEDRVIQITDIVKGELSKVNPALYSKRWNELLPQLKEIGLTDDALAVMQKEVFGPKGLKLKTDSKLPDGVVGRFNPENPTDIEVGKGAGPAIPAHEGFHEQWSKMTNEERARWKAASADELAAVNSERMKENKPAYGEEEWFAMQGSVEFLQRGLNTRKEGGFKKWLEDTKAVMKQQFGKDVTAEDLLRAHNYRLMNESRGVKPMVGGEKGEKSATADENLGAEYNQLQLALKDRNTPFNDKLAAWKRIEEIRNMGEGAAKGMPPGKESGATVEEKLPINPEWRQDQREDMQGLYGKDRYATEGENIGGSTDPEVLAALNKKRYLSKQLASKLNPEDQKLTVDQLLDKYSDPTTGKRMSERTLYRRISSGLPLDAVVAKGRKSATEALGLNLQEEVLPVEGATEGGPEVKATRRPASELGEEFVEGGKFNENARIQVADKVEQRVRGLLAKRGMSEIPENLDLKAITDLVIADMENYGMEPFTVKDTYARNLPHTLAGKPNFRKTVEMRTDMYAQREVRDFLKTAENTRYSIDRPANEETGETIAANLSEEGGFPTEFLSDTPPEEVHGTDLATRAKQSREDFIEPPSKEELYEDTLPDEAVQARKDAELEAAQHVPNKKTRTKEYQFKATDTVPRKELIHTNMLALEAKRAELRALKNGMSLGLFKKNFIEKNRMLKVAGLKMHPAEDALQTHYRHAFEEASQYSDMGKYETLNPREAKAARQRLINIIESDIEAIKLMQQDLLFRADVPVNLKEFAAKYAETHEGAGKIEYEPVRKVVPTKIEEQPKNVIQSRQGKTYRQTPELTGPAKEPLTAKPKEYVMYNDNINSTKRVQSQEEVASLKKEGYRLLRTNTGEEVGSRFATAEENIGVRRSFFKMTEAAADRLVDVDPKLGKAFRRWDVQKDIYEGWGNEAIHDLSKFDTADINKVAAIHRDAFRNGKPLPSLSGKEKEISKILTNYYHDDVGMERNRLGMKIGGKAGSLTPSYVPDMLSPQAIDLLVNKATTPAGIKAANDWANHIVKESAGKITLPEATEYVDQYTRAMGSGKDNNYLSVEFGALRKAEGYGVPDNLRETDAVAALSRYARRAATDMAMFKEMQANKEVGAMLGLKDDTGKTITSPGIKPLDKDRRVQDAMKWVTGNYASGKAALNSPRLTATSRLVNNLILGPITALKDSASVPVNMLPYINRFSDLGAAWSGAMDMRKNAREAIRYGATKPSMDKIAFADVMTSPDKTTEVLRKMASFARVLQGRETIENLNRDLTFSIGKELARSNVLGAKNGHAKSKLFVKNFGELVEGDVTKLSGADLEEALNIMAKNFTDRNQGSYGVRGLPTGIVDSQFAPFLALQKWSVEKNNVIYKDVIAPFISGENRLPMLTYTLGSVMTGAAIQQLNRLLSGRKSQDPELKEVLAAGDAKDYVAQLATLMQLGSYAGIVGDGMKAAADAVVYGKTPRNLASFPTASLAFDLQEKIADVAEALKNDEDPMKVFQLFAVDVLSQNIQGARMIANRTINEGKIERSDKFRDLRVFKQMGGAPNADFPKVNPYLNIDAKRFKRTDDLGEAMGLVPALMKRAMEQSEGNPEKLRKKLAGLKGISYNTMPNMSTQPVEFQEYYQYLVTTQGKEEADTRMADFLRQSAMNKMKSGMFPSL